MMSQSMAVMHGMMTVKLTGNPNVDFVEGMIPHHEAAIKMADVVMPYLKDQQIKTFAENIVKAQEHEVAFMKAWLAKQAA
ncbi:putative exported protein [Photobacterium aphoticum]|uniref:Putative exported protein n=1 Tax=Photobacterium aphoticum TaxID=754436 RepID=A0A090QRM6_9GAMM|nr:putative exported protein [Photobacterium aphoticum]